jgi:2-polyprenyl-6-hydroxyphenyl methylase/3-demethylubiquinone-9 3-methyltransferase
MLDFGGGFGTLARIVGRNCPNIIVDIFEPSPSDYAKNKSKKFKNINFINLLEYTKETLYDCIVAFDVMEHLVDPLGNLKTLVTMTNIGGYLIFANNFHPIIKCHLPSNFHFRYTFSFFTQILGLKHVAKCSNTHANIYQKIKTVRCNDALLKKLEVVSRSFFPFLVSLSAIR